MTLVNEVVRRATGDDLDRAAAVLTEAFADYAWTRWAIPEQDYARRLRELQHLYLQHALNVGIVLVNQSVSGVIALLPPHAAEPSEDVQARVAHLYGDRLESVFGVALPSAPQGFWTLETVGVLPSVQGQGLGAQLVLAGVAAVVDAGGPGVALETSAESNVRLYERSGFVLRETTRVQNGPIVHSMDRVLR